MAFVMPLPRPTATPSQGKGSLARTVTACGLEKYIVRSFHSAQLYIEKYRISSKKRQQNMGINSTNEIEQANNQKQKIHSRKLLRRSLSSNKPSRENDAAKIQINRETAIQKLGFDRRRQ